MFFRCFFCFRIFGGFVFTLGFDLAGVPYDSSEDKARPGETVEFLNASAGKESARMGATMDRHPGEKEHMVGCWVLLVFSTDDFI